MELRFESICFCIKVLSCQRNQIMLYHLEKREDGRLKNLVLQELLNLLIERKKLLNMVVN